MCGGGKSLQDEMLCLHNAEGKHDMPPMFHLLLTVSVYMSLHLSVCQSVSFSLSMSVFLSHFLSVLSLLKYNWRCCGFRVNYKLYLLFLARLP